MEGLSSEVSEKIRAAIRAKLVSLSKGLSVVHSSPSFCLQKELGAYVDDELPDYIMVLVANKKTQEQMKEDLQLFLHHHAEVFTAWLQDILNKLKHVTKQQKQKPDDQQKAAKKEKKKKEVKKKKKKSLDKPPDSPPKRQRMTSRSSPVRRTSPRKRPRSRSPIRDHQDRYSQRARRSPSPARKRVHSVVSKVTEYDPEAILKKSLMASQVQVPPRPSRQAMDDNSKSSRKLLIRAMEDTDKSLSRRRAEIRQKDVELQEIHARRMKATLAAKRYKNPAATEQPPNSSRRKRREKSPSSSSSSSSESSEDDLRLRLEQRRKAGRKEEPPKKVQQPRPKTKEAPPPRPVAKTTPTAAEEHDAELELIRQRALNSMLLKQRQKEQEEKKILIPLNDDTSDDDDEEDPIEKDPKFIVTLDGINSSYFKSKDTNDDSNANKIQFKKTAIIAPMKHEEIVEKKQEAEPAKVKKPERKRITAPPPDDNEVKKSVRKRITAPEPDAKPIPVVTTKEVCKFWPRCKNGDNCVYLHPKSAKPVLSVNSALPANRDKFKWTSKS